MKSKVEVIKEKWGEYFVKVELFIDENGWVNHNNFKDKYFLNYKDFDTQGNYYRPKSLQGIDDNFGWISINSEKDLPNMDQLTYDVCCIGNRILEDVSLKDLLSLNESKILTHYSIHEKRLKPLHK